MRHSTTDRNSGDTQPVGSGSVTLFWEKWRRTVISVFIVFNILAIALGSTLPAAQRGPLARFFTPYAWWTRILQNWQLFTPTPRKFIMNYRAEITFKDGTKKTWRRPYPPNWDFFPRHLSYHFQRWDLAAGYLEQPVLSTLLLTDLAHYLEKVFADPANPPVEIAFIRAKAPVPPPLETGYVQPDFSHPLWHDDLLQTYSVQSGKMK